VRRSSGSRLRSRRLASADRLGRREGAVFDTWLTIGHSKHPIEKFLTLLRQHDVEVLVDVRSQPFSRFSPQFSRKASERAVTEASIRYLFMGDSLGGRPEPRECYDADGKVDYDRVEEQEFYQRGIEGSGCSMASRASASAFSAPRRIPRSAIAAF